MAIVWDETMFRKWYSLASPSGGFTTYSRVGWRYYRGPEFSWNYAQNAQYPDYPLNEYRYRMEHLVSKFGIQPSSRVLLLGPGYGALMEAFIWFKTQNGIAEATAQSQIAGIDNSQFIQGNLTAEGHPLVQGKIINRSLLDGAAVAGMRNALRNTAGGSEFFDFVISESVIESYTDAERPAFITACESYQQNTGTTTKNLSRVIHAVFPLVAHYGWNATEPTYQGWNPVPDGGAPNRVLSSWAETRPQNSWISLVGDMPMVAGTG